MADGSKAEIPAKWDGCLDLGLRRFVYSSLAGAVSGFLIFRSPATRWASIAFGAGVGIGSAYSECSLKFDKSPPKLTSNVSSTPLPEGDE
ncbi:Mitochondrial inner membrane organizing system component [Salvia divinorum]|uniref:Mitochondrial inner membrane organizing system component n=1 Tax=Salvia divinorum TaxID=28513 RepID=A0ABD1I7W6_SALDI